MVGWLVGKLVCLLVGKLVGWLVGWFFPLKMVLVKDGALLVSV